MREWRCSYVVGLAPAAGDDELRDLAAYLSSLSLAGCEVVVLDDSPRSEFERNARILRWVGRHLPVRGEFRTRNGEADLVLAAMTVAGCEKVLLAGSDVRWPEAAIDQACSLLDRHEAVEPQHYLAADSWWSAVDAGWTLLERGIDGGSERATSIALRRSALRTLRLLRTSDDSLGAGRRLSGIGAQVLSPRGLFVRRLAGDLPAWIRRRPVAAGIGFDQPLRTGFFLSLLPLLVFFAVAGGAGVALSLVGALALASVAVSFRGRIGAAPYFPLRTCLFAPLAVMERSISVYWALYLKLAGDEFEEGAPATESARDARRASSR